MKIACDCWYKKLKDNRSVERGIPDVRCSCKKKRQKRKDK